MFKNVPFSWSEHVHLPELNQSGLIYGPTARRNAVTKANVKSDRKMDETLRKRHWPAYYYGCKKNKAKQGSKNAKGKTPQTLPKAIHNFNPLKVDVPIGYTLPSRSNLHF